jgi:hypothetical protein
MGKKGQINQQRLHDELHAFTHQAGVQEIMEHCQTNPDAVPKILQWLRSGLMEQCAAPAETKKFSRSYCKLGDLGKGRLMSMMCDWEMNLQRQHLEQIAKSNISHIMSLFCFCVSAPSSEKLWSKLIDEFDDIAAARYTAFGSRLRPLPELLRKAPSPLVEVPWADFGYYTLRCESGMGPYTHVAHVSGATAPLPSHMKWDQGLWTIAFNWAEETATLKCSDPGLKGVSINVMELFPSDARASTFVQATPDDIKKAFNDIREKRKASDASASGAAAPIQDSARQRDPDALVQTPAAKKQCLEAKKSEAEETPEAVSPLFAGLPAPPAGFGGKRLAPPAGESSAAEHDLDRA